MKYVPILFFTSIISTIEEMVSPFFMSEMISSLCLTIRRISKGRYQYQEVSSTAVARRIYLNIMPNDSNCLKFSWVMLMILLFIEKFSNALLISLKPFGIEQNIFYALLDCSLAWVEIFLEKCFDLMCLILVRQTVSSEFADPGQ